jgi:hypothetical protein
MRAVAGVSLVASAIVVVLMVPAASSQRYVKPQLNSI